MGNVIGNSSTAATPAVLGENTGHGRGVVGESKRGEGVRGVGHGGQAAVVGVNDWAPPADPLAPPDRTLAGGNGGWFESKEGEGVRGVSHNAHGGVVGVNDWAPATPPGAGGPAGWFESSQGEGVRGWAKTPHHGGVVGVNTAGGFGVYGRSDNGNGVVGESTAGVGVYGKGGRAAGFFEGNVEVTGDIRLTNADCAEDFNVPEAACVEPGTVMVLGEDEILLPSHRAYDRRVAGVISGAGNYKPGIVLDKQDTQQRRLPVALLGKVFCKVDARFGAIAVGDLLTTSPTPGHAMRADDPMKAFGAVIGKALRPLTQGHGLIPILIALQ